MTDTMTTKSRKTKAKSHRLFPDELIDQLLAQVQNKDAGSILGEFRLAGQLKSKGQVLTQLFVTLSFNRDSTPTTRISRCYLSCYRAQRAGGDFSG